jgi:hypothetical protein
MKTNAIRLTTFIAVVTTPSVSDSLLDKFITTLPQHTLNLAQVNVPALGCPQDGQVGPQSPPKLPKTIRVTIPAEAASFLAFYSPHDDLSLGVLAPQQWRCFGTYGSGARPYT